MIDVVLVRLHACARGENVAIGRMGVNMAAIAGPANDDRRVDVLGVHVSATSLDGAVDRIASWIAGRDRAYVCVTGVHGVMESQSDPRLAAIHNASGMTTPDGMPLVWACRRAGVETTTRVYGPDLMTALCARAAAEGWRIFLYGGADGTPELLAERLGRQHRGLVVAGTHSPPFRPLTEAEQAAVVAMIDRSRADIVFVGLSTPKQERWMHAMRPWLEAPVLIGVGAAFDIHAGLLRQAPGWMQRSGLEWLFRLAVEPRRLWRRYLANNPRFVAAVVRRPPQLLQVASSRDVEGDVRSGGAG